MIYSHNAAYNTAKYRQTTDYSGGYTLIELSLVLIILGLLLGGGFTAYQYYFKADQQAETQAEITEIAAKLNDFRIKHGRYPCPANLLSQKSWPDYGRESPCHKITSFTDHCMGGVCKTSDGQRVLDEIPFPISRQDRQSLSAQADILIGGVPAKTLGLGDDYASDGFGAFYLYAVTADLAIEDAQNAGLGAIKVVDEQGQSVLKGRGNAAFIVLSFGQNSVRPHIARFGGSPSISGPISGQVISSCQNSAQDPSQESADIENCDMDGVFRLAPLSSAAGSSYFDDIVFYTYSHSAPNWQPLFNTQGDIFNKLSTVGTVTIGDQDIAQNIGGNDNKDIDDVKQQWRQAQLQLRDGRPYDAPIIDGNISFPKLEIHGDLTARGDVSSAALCNADLQNCFPPALIAGHLANTQDGSGAIKCPDGEFMIGIQNGQAICDRQFTCPSGLFLSRLDGASHGTNNANNAGISQFCTHLPVSCQQQDITICNRQYRLPARDDFQTFILNIGYSKRVTYACEANAWVLKSDQGDCHCRTKKREREAPCENGFEGSLLVQEQLSCRGNGGNAGNTGNGGAGASGWRVIKVIENNCKCAPITQDREQACAPGYAGTITHRRQFQCPQAIWGPWSVTQDNCLKDFDPE